MEEKAIVVLHPFQQHSFKTSEAVKNAGMLSKYITTVYDKKGSWTRRLKCLLSREDRMRSNNRRTEGLDDDDVLQLCEIRALFLLFLQRVDKKRMIYNWYFLHLIRVFNRKAYCYLKKQMPDAIIVYDTLSADLIKKIKSEKMATKIIMDMSAPYYNYMEKEFRKDIERHPSYSGELLEMIQSPLYSYRREYSKTEIELSDAFFVASDFTRKSLVQNGVDKRIYLCQYGIDDILETAQNNEITHLSTNSQLRVIYVGRVNQAKGAFLLISIAERFNKENVRFDFYGSYNPQSEMIKNAPENCLFHGHVPKQTILKDYNKADILVLPSLSDGFGFVVPEALVNGVPVLVSDNVGASQLIENGKNGYVFSTGNEIEVIDLLQRFVDHPEILKQMHLRVSESVKHLTWKEYGRKVEEALNDIV